MKKKLVLFLICFILMVSPLPLHAEGEETVTLTYYPPFTTETIQEEYPYSDDWFLQDSAQYNHLLAQASIGLANAGNRANDVPVEGSDKNIIDFTTAMGFGNGVSEQINEKPTKDTIGTYISSKEIGDVTLVCVGVRGQGYGDEWMSNLFIGSGTRHNGFDQAAQIVESRIRNYLETYNLKGNVKLWIAGFSRAAAVTNITAADMVDSGLFKDVYAYCYACPRTTQEVGNYPSIFNIMGTCDIVPMVSFADWGYERYGVDRYISAQEVDSEYATKILNNDIKHPDRLIRNDVPVNHQLHVLLEYLVDLCPTSDSYVELLQSRLIEAWNLKDNGSIYQMLLAVLEDVKAVDATHADKVNELLDYFSTVIGTYLQSSTVQENHEGWSLDDSIGSNLFLEHNCETYSDWMLSSDNPEDIYTDNIAQMRFVVSSHDSYVVDIFDPEGYVQSVNQDGELFYRDIQNSVERNTETLPVLYTRKIGTQTVIIIPEDERYMLTLSSDQDASVEYFGTRYDGHSLIGETSEVRSLDMEAGKSYFVISDNESKTNFLSGDAGKTFDAWDSSIPYSPSLVMHLENMNVLHLSFSQMMMLIIGNIVFFLLFIIIATVTAIRRKIKKLKVNRVATIIIHVTSAIVFFVMQQIVNIYMPEVPQLKAVFTGLVTFSALMLAIQGYLADHRQIDLFICLDLFCCMIGDFFIGILPMIGSICYIIGGIIFCVGFFKTIPIQKWQMFLWVGLEAILAIVLWMTKGNAGFDFFAFLYFGLLISRLISVLPLRNWVIVVPVLYLISDGWNRIFTTSVATSIGVNLVYYVGIMLLAILTWSQHDWTQMETKN